MRHARDDDLARLAPLLEELRLVGGLVEKNEGVFYRKSKAFLHFHVDGNDVYADVRLDAAAGFERTKVTTKAEQRALVRAVRHVDGS